MVQVIPQEIYIVNPNEAVISPYLNEKRQAILDGTFACENYKNEYAASSCFVLSSR